MAQWWGRLIVGLLVGLLVLVVMMVGTVWLQAHREYKFQEQRAQAAETRLAELRSERAQRETYLRLVLEDPKFLERVVRERLGYVRPNETLFRFEEPAGNRPE
ncbi:MAG: septum formation initiator family protein [Verrucomicrobiota bacterium JB022]|nr:septum formation initiator family protein [Verrucomicrobiota bacterium JB022]